MLSELPIELPPPPLPLLPTPLVDPPPREAAVLVAPVLLGLLLRLFEPPTLLPALLLPGVEPVEEVDELGELDEVGKGVWVVAIGNLLMCWVSAGETGHAGPPWMRSQQ
ncbi:MAG: hypothetical protein H0W48_11960 [Methylibium sp.]|nr:hypothetical protein [Methylibium sp.]